MGLEFLSPLRRYAEAHATLDRALQIAPGDHGVIAAKAVVVQNMGRLDQAAEQLANIPNDSKSEFVELVRLLQLMFERRFDQAIAQANSRFRLAGEPLSGTAKEVLVYLGYCYELAGRNAEARATFARALTAIKPSVETIVPVDSRLLPCFLALAYAGPGEKEQAFAQAHQAVVDYQRDALETPYVAGVLAQIQARFGDSDAAISAIPRLLNVPAGTTHEQLRLHPLWDPLRSDPRFGEIVAANQSTAKP